MESDTERYQSKPMLRFLDAYVLDCIGLLDDATSDLCERFAPSLASALKVDASTWQVVVELSMDMPRGSRAELRELWLQAVEIDRARGWEPDALVFARELVDFRFQS